MCSQRTPVIVSKQDQQRVQTYCMTQVAAFCLKLMDQDIHESHNVCSTVKAIALLLYLGTFTVHRWQCCWPCAMCLQACRPVYVSCVIQELCMALPKPNYPLQQFSYWR